ncbi:MAG: DUF1893 domain-containing protein [Candidatus Parvarchaeota archaeon]|nr:DUF1893 domain-containing protein [Candidatus Jingweiarchaeum tengchongense]MCW1298124.1 DUF1893 domain-containing protein [Candidatus Jingweiarchaeum tengchongense]MCW1305545.1 DUF1893 domain-containing protein [Candidatus Jingweiarchaeum tengchongense]MCW1310363.1 DUF1893 domain-containing protein [Candidatus Jingweiarchaeum tengchongense]
MDDVRIAREELKKRGFNLIIVKNHQIIFKSRLSGIRGFLVAIDDLGEKMNGASVADKIVGKAVAMLCSYTKVDAVFATIMSKEAKKWLSSRSIYFEYENLVPRILSGDQECPFERLVKNFSSPRKAYEEIKTLQKRLSSR